MQPLRRCALLAVIALGCARCTTADAQAGDADAAQGHDAASQQENGAGDHGAADAPPFAVDTVREPGALATVDALAVHGRVGPDGRAFAVARRTREVPGAHARNFGTRALMLGLRTRTPDLTQYPCTACHLGRTIAAAAERPDDAHQDIPAVHPEAAGAGCMACHARADVEQLELRSGEQVTMDHAYRVCAQCHFSQVDDWAAGAHGKRLDGWQGRRVVMGCADCHDPHQPALQARVPFRAPRLHRNRDREP
jgi:hypothetical protein